MGGVAPNTDHYRADIDGLRAIAVAAVVAFHAFPERVPGGFIGVDVFFVISGYLISGLIFRDLERGRFSFAAFYARRIRRIFPALVLILGAALAFGWFSLIADEYRRLARHVDGAAGFALNFTLAHESGYFDTDATLKPLLHLWSLAIEEQFYIAWPLILFVSWRWTRSLLGVVAALCAVSFAINVWSVGSSPDSAFYLPLSRFWELLVGSIAAWLDLRHGAKLDAWLERGAARGLSRADLAAGVGTALLGAGIFGLREADAFPGWWALLPTAATLLVIAAGPQAWWNRAVLARPAFVAVGLVSYPLYLWHWPLLSLAAIIAIGPVATSTKLALVGASLVLAWLTYQLVEKPIRFGARLRGSKPFGAREKGLVAAMLVVAAAAGVVNAGHGFPGRFTSIDANAPKHWLRVAVDPDCERFVNLPDRQFGYCKLVNPHAHELVAIIGDSHAESLFPGLSEKFAERGAGAVLLSNQGCPMFEGTTVGGTELERDKCARMTEQVLGVVLSRDEIKEVVLSARGAFWITGRGFGLVEQRSRHKIIISSDGTRDAPGLPAFREGLRRTVLELLAHGKRVTYVLDVPELGFMPRSCLERPSWLRPAHACEVARAEVDARQNEFREVVYELARSIPGLRVLDPLPLFCDGTRCRARDGRLVLYEDDDHLSAAGSRLIAAHLF